MNSALEDVPPPHTIPAGYLMVPKEISTCRTDRIHNLRASIQTKTNPEQPHNPM